LNLFIYNSPLETISRYWKEHWVTSWSFEIALIIKIKLHSHTSTILSTNWTWVKKTSTNELKEKVIEEKYSHENLRGEDVENCEAFEGVVQS